MTNRLVFTFGDRARTLKRAVFGATNSSAYFTVAVTDVNGDLQQMVSTRKILGFLKNAPWHIENAFP